MLITEHHANGTVTVRFHKDWTPARISRAYIPPIRNHVASDDAYRLQSGLLKARQFKSPRINHELV